jgi:hypothetical protein
MTNTQQPSDVPNPIGGSDESKNTTTLGEASQTHKPRDLDVANPKLEDLRPEDMADIEVDVTDQAP